MGAQVRQEKNVALSKMLSAEKTKSADINHRAWRDKKENLTLLTETTKSHHTLLTETTKSHQAELEKQQDDTKEKLRNERRRFNEELKKRQDENEEKLLNERRVTARTPGPPSLTNIHSRQPQVVRSRELSQNLNLFKGSFRLLGAIFFVRGNHLYYFSYFATFSNLLQKLLVSLVKTPIC